MSKMLSNPVAVLIWTKIGQNAPSCTVTKQIVSRVLGTTVSSTYIFYNFSSTKNSFLSLESTQAGEAAKEDNVEV